MTVVVAVDSSDRSAEAIRLADRESRYRNSPLIAMTAYQSGRATGVPGGKPIGTMQTGAAREAAADLIVLAVRPAMPMLPGTVSQARLARLCSVLKPGPPETACTAVMAALASDEAAADDDIAC